MTESVRVPFVTEQEATGETARIYAEIRETFGFGFVPDIFQVVSTRTSFLRVHWAGYRSMFSEGVLDREVKEMIATLVARDAGCEYCTYVHALFLELIGAGSELAEAIKDKPVDEMPVAENVRELLRLVERINRDAYKINDCDFERLRQAGWNDDALLEAVWTACLFNAIVRLADTVGLYRLGQLTETTPAQD